MTAITLLGDPDYQKYTKYLPLAGKIHGSVASMAEQDPLKVKVMGSNPITPSKNKTLSIYNKLELLWKQKNVLNVVNINHLTNSFLKIKKIIKDTLNVLFVRERIKEIGQKKNMDRITINKKNKVIENKKKYCEFLSTKSCVDCGNDDIRVFELDHINPENKEHNLGDLIRSSYSWKKIENELKKCEVRCSNCHRIKTLIKSYRNKYYQTKTKE